MTERAGVDLRLVPSALAIWAVTLVGLVHGWVVGTALTGLAALGAVVVWGTAGPRSWRRGALGVLIMAVIAGGGISARTHQIEHHPLRAAAETGEMTTMRLTLDERPKQLRGASYGAREAKDRSMARATLRYGETAGQRIRSGDSVLLLSPTRDWRGLIAGQSVTVRAKVIPPRDHELLVAVVSTYQAPQHVAEPPRWQRVAEDLRDGLRRVSTDQLGPDAAGLLPGLVVGDTDGLTAATEREFEIAGLTHLTAVSGANVAIVCGAVLLLLHLVGAGPVVSAVAAGLALAGFVVLAGPEPSVLRAAVMGTITLAALVLGRQRSVLPALAASVGCLVLLIPDLAVAIGFALSVAATAGLIVLAPGWTAALRNRGIPVGVAEAVVVPAAAQVVAAPLVAAISGEISIVAVVANLVVAPVVAPATVLGVVATVLTPVSDGLAGAAVWLTGLELEWLLAVARYAAAIPGAVVEWPAGGAGGLLLAGITVVLLIVLRGRRVRWTIAVLVLIAGILLVPGRIGPNGWPATGWRMVACDVGQGDALVLATGSPGEAVVVDTGPDPVRTVECLRRLGIRRVPLVVLTHLHADHVSGLPAILENYPTAAVALGPLREPSWAMADIARDTKRRSVPTIELSRGQRLHWPRLALHVLGPTDSARNGSDDDANDSSLVLRADTEAGRVLLTGDIELAGQAQLLAADVDLRAEVLKIPHHGSRYTTPRFLRAVNPRVGIVSVGAGNSYGHPSPLVVGELTRMGANVLRTDHSGDIAVLGRRRDDLRTLNRGDPIRAEEG